MAADETATTVAVVGAGPAGLTAAVALADAGVPTALIGRTSPADNRTSALLHGSVTALGALGVWQRCAGAEAPLRVLRIADDTGRLWRAPEARFAAGEIGLDAFAWNVANRDLLSALKARAAELPSLTEIGDDAAAVTFGAAEAVIALAGGGTVTAKLVVAADGRHSLCRAAAGIATDARRYPQTALTFNLRHTRPHHDTSTEFHTSRGPFTLVPLPGNRSSLVWVTDPAEARRIAALADAALDAEIERRAHSILGKIVVEDGRGAFPLAVETAQRFAAERLVLVGEAAHTLPPIGAQGLNLGLRDAALIAELAADAHASGGDPGARTVTDRYDRDRRADAARIGLAADLLNRSLLSDFLPLQGARGLSLYLLDRIGPLRRAVMREGVTPARSAPRLMRGERETAQGD